MNFYDILKDVEDGYSINPYAGQRNKEWIVGFISVNFLNEHFSQYETAEQMKNATNSEGLKLYFDYLKEQGILN